MQSLASMLKCACLMVLIGVACGGPQPASAAGPELEVPGIKLVAGRSSPILTEYRGKVVLLDFWASWCATCKVSLPFLDRMQRKYAARGLQVLTVNVDTERSAADALLKKLNPSFSVVFDPEGKLPEAFGIQSMPTSFLIDREGAVQEKHEGFRESHEHAIESEILRLLGLGDTVQAS